jgi:hypothetical protein
VLLEHRRHGQEVAAGKGHLRRKPVLLRVEMGVPGDPPPWLLELSDRKQDPAVEVRA